MASGRQTNVRCQKPGPAAFKPYLIPTATWTTLCQTGASRLALTGDAASYLAEQQTRMEQQLTALQAALGPESGLILNDDGTFHLTALEESVPPAAKALSKRLYRMLPRMDLPDLLADVQRSTGFLDHATHLTTDLPLLLTETAPLIAAILATGLNIGLSAMEKASPFSARQLAWVSDWYLREPTLQAMLTTLDHTIIDHPLSALWGDGTSSTSDGLRVRMGVKVANAVRNKTFFDEGRGITIYLYLIDTAPSRQVVIQSNNREAWYVIDNLCNHETAFEIRQHTTDTGGSSEQVFGMCRFLGFRFTPRLADPLGLHLWTIGKPGSYGPLNALLKGRISTTLITAEWEEMQRFAGSIKHGTVPASVLMQKLASFPRQNRTAQAFAEVGKLEKTSHLLEIYRSEAFRRELEIRLNRHESANGLGRALFFGRRGVMWDRAFEDQMHRASCLVILMAAIIAWNTAYLHDAITKLRAQGEDIPDALVAHIAPLGWLHLNLLGQFPFRTQAYSLEKRRPLRTDAEASLDEPLDDEQAGQEGYW